jgi:hypothetical protein
MIRPLADILENLERIEDYVAGLDREAFGGDTLRLLFQCSISPSSRPLRVREQNIAADH